MKKTLLILSVLLVIFSSCTSWLDINQNPNDVSKTSVSMSLMLPGCQYDIVEYHSNSSYAHMLSQHLTKSGEVSGSFPMITGDLTPQNMDTWWSTYYTLNSDILAIYDKAVEAEDKAYKGIAQVLFVMNSHRLVDIFGDVPYTQSWKPLEFETPVYDKGEDIYADLFVRLDEAISSFEGAISDNYITSSLSTVDIMCGGDLNMWLKMANSLKLRLLMRISNVQNVASQVAAIANNCLAVNDNILVNPGFYFESGKMNIFYEDYGWDKNGAPSSSHNFYMPTNILVDMLRDNDDPRLRVFIEPRAELGDPEGGEADFTKYGLENERYVGIPFGQQSPPGKENSCTIGTGLLAGGSNLSEGAVKGSVLFTGVETNLLLAEAALRGLIPGGDAKAKEYYEASVIAAFERHSEALIANDYADADIMIPAITVSAEESAKSYLSQDNSFMNWSLMSSDSEKMAAIGAQKWLNFFGYNPMEAWAEYRRTGYPYLKASNQAPVSKIMSRMIYPQSEMNKNTINYELQPEIDVYESLVFWDLENGIVDRTELYF